MKNIHILYIKMNIILVVKLFNNFQSIFTKYLSHLQEADITDLKQEIGARRHSAMLKEEKWPGKEMSRCTPGSLT